MAKSLFGNNKNSNMADKYREQNEAAIRQERADELDDKIKELSNASKNEAWANEVISFYDEKIKLNEDIFDIMVNLALVKQLYKEAQAYLQRLKEKAEADKKNKELASKLAAEREIAEIDEAIMALFKAAKSEYWCADVNELKARVKGLSVSARAKIKSLPVLDELGSIAAKVLRALPLDKEIARLKSARTQGKEWCQEVVKLEGSIDGELIVYLKNKGDLDQMVQKASAELERLDKDAKAKKAAADKKAREEKAARDAATEAENARIAEQERQREEQIKAKVSSLKQQLASAKMGKSVFFGNHAQSAEGKMEPIEWDVVYNESGRMWLISKKVISTCAYGLGDFIYGNYTYSGVGDPDKFNWANSNVRNYLNGEFYQEVFDEAEKRLIVESENKSKYGVQMAKRVTTKDKVYIPAEEEILSFKYFKNKKRFIAEGTPVLRRYVCDAPGLEKKCKKDKYYAPWLLRDTNVSVYQYPAKRQYILFIMGSPKKTLGDTARQWIYLSTDNLSAETKKEKIGRSKQVGGIRPMIELNLL